MCKINPIPDRVQPTLFPATHHGEFKTVAEARVHMGNRMEDLVCSALCLTPIAINGKYDVNFDAGTRILGRESYFEVKSVRKGSKSPIYDFRVGKETQAAERSGVDVFYAFAVHACKGLTSHDDVARKILDQKTELYVLEHSEVVELLKDLPLNKIKKEGKNGYNREGYMEGYRNLAVTSIRERANHLALHTAAPFEGEQAQVGVNASRAATEIILQLLLF